MVKTRSLRYRFESSPISGTLASTTVVEARETFMEDLLRLGQKAEAEAEGVAELAKELKGDPYNSTKYCQAMALIEALFNLKKVLNNTVNYERPAAMRED